MEVCGGTIVDEYETLVNPGQGIPSMIASLTGITSDMTDGAPYFDHIAEDALRDDSRDERSWRTMRPSTGISFRLSSCV